MSNNGQWRPAPVGSKENPAPQSHFEAANIGDDYKVYQDDAGDRVIEHLPSGTMWKHKADGTLVTQSVSTNNLSLAGNSISAILESESAGTREEHGIASHADPGTASDGTWNTSVGDTTGVSFGTAFSSSPVVVPGNHTSVGLQETPNVSTTGFDSVLRNFRSDVSTGKDSYWLAVGPE